MDVWQRVNNFFYDVSSNNYVVGTMLATKHAGYSRVKITISCKPDNVLEGGEVVEMNIAVNWSKADGGTQSPYYWRAIECDPTWSGTEWREESRIFSGFPTNDECILNIMILRCNFTTLGTNADEDFYVRRTQVELLP